MRHRCVVCHKLTGKLSDEKMSDVPKERISSDPPFTHCWLDMFGPFTVKKKKEDLS